MTSCAERAIAATQLYVYMQICAREQRSFHEDLDRILGEVNEAGYPAVEGFLTLCDTDESAHRFQHLLQRHNLACPSLYTGGNLHDPETAPAAVEQIVERARRAAAVGVTAITVNPDVTPERKTDDQLELQAEWLNRLAGRLRQEGLSTWLHNHDPEMREEGRELRSNLERTDPALVGFCADLHWIWRGGGNPYDYLERYADRLGSLHLRNSRDGVWCEALEDGDIDFQRVSRILARKDFNGAHIVELAIEGGTPQTRSSAENQALSRAYLKQRFGV